jgi:hypothetical protein
MVVVRVEITLMVMKQRLNCNFNPNNNYSFKPMNNYNSNTYPLSQDSELDTLLEKCLRVDNRLSYDILIEGIFRKPNFNPYLNFNPNPFLNLNANS